MVRAGSTVLLFGGIDSVDQAIAPPSHHVYGDTWQWDGSAWTQVQDIGPPGRWLHSMTFELAETRVVLFGGRSVFAPPEAPIGTGQLGDTWGHVEEDEAIFVSPIGDDSNSGTILSPKGTINAAVVAAAGMGREVRVAAGTYDEGAGVEVANDTSILGGYDPATWVRSMTAITHIVGSPQAVTADGKTGVILDGLTLEATAPGGSAYGIRAINGSSLQLVDVQVVAGDGAPGTAGAAGAIGATGASGLAGGAGSCDNAVGGAGGPGGASPIGASGGSGGTGGSTGAGASGNQGAGGASAGAGGAAGNPGSPGGAGLAGQPGSAGGVGTGGVGSTAASLGWHGASGGPGKPGTAGTGGGGGGGGGAQLGPLVDDGGGNGGGGGGAGGGGGLGGSGGGAAGGSFGIYLMDSSVTITGSTITTGTGGAGGEGGTGGPGGAGGLAGQGGTACTGEVGAGGSGGSGGHGGAGGPGGGGAGGPSIGIFRRGASSATVSGSTVLVGVAGQGGLPNGTKGLEGDDVAG